MIPNDIDEQLYTIMLYNPIFAGFAKYQRIKSMNKSIIIKYEAVDSGAVRSGMS